jgi:hypothetical protein
VSLRLARDREVDALGDDEVTGRAGRVGAGGVALAGVSS